MDFLWFETCWSTFEYFVILIASTYYLLCISWIIKCLIIIDIRCKNEDSHVLYSVIYSRKSSRLWNNVEKYSTARQDTDDIITRRMNFSCWINTTTNTHSEYIIVIAFPWRQLLCESVSILCLCVNHLFCYMYYEEVSTLNNRTTSFSTFWQGAHREDSEMIAESLENFRSLRYKYSKFFIP